MLDKNALSQLSQAKQQIQESKDYAEGVVRGTNNRFGFVLLDDGREAFLAPDRMQQVLPGDRIKVSVTTNDRKKLDASLEKLLQSDLKTFVGQYVIKGKNHFVAADYPQLNRRFFVPPKERKQYRDGDYVACRITRHPFGDGRAQIKITQLIGKPDQAGVERDYMIAKYELPTQFPKSAVKEMQDLLETPPVPDTDERRDYRDLPWVTIDAPTTRDMDDALYAEKTAAGLRLVSAIADPTAFVEPGSALDRAAQSRACSVYLTGGSLGMFPRQLTEEVFSLAPNQERMTLVCDMTIADDGGIQSYAFYPGLIKVHHKLSYDQVTQFLEDTESTSTTELDNTTQESLTQLAEIADRRHAYRRHHCVVQEESIDYHYHLDDAQKIADITVRRPSRAHQLVEEAMLATNCCAGEFLAQNAPEQVALFSAHAGFRRERLQEIEQFLRKDRPELAHGDLTTLEGYRDLLGQLQASSDDQVIQATLKRLLQPGTIATTPAPHFGLGFEHYALATSPIRRYQDLHNHRLIKQLVRDESIDSDASVIAEQLQPQIIKTRQACRQLDQWLLCDYLKDKVGQTFPATVVAVSNQGIAVRLDDVGADSFIPMRSTDEHKAKYDSTRMQLTYKGTTYYIEKPLNVILDKVDPVQRQLTLRIVEEEAETTAANQ